MQKITDRMQNDEDMKNIDDSLLASKTRNPPVSENSSLETINVVQLTLLERVMTNSTIQQPQTSTSNGSTTTNTGNPLGHQMDPGELLIALKMMREMGFTDKNLNLSVLQLTNDLETAVEWLLNGFGVKGVIKDGFNTNIIF